MNAVAENPRAIVGNNLPPEAIELTPFEASKLAILDLYAEAAQWLDGEPITTQDAADAVNTLKAAIKKAADIAEENRKVEVKPLQDQVSEIQARYNELIGNNKSVTGLAIKAEQACNAALKPYLIKLAQAQEAAALLARQEAERAQQVALAAMRERDAANLAQREEAERLVNQAKQAEQAAKRAEGAKAHAKGDGRATGLRTVYRAVIADQREAAAWLWSEHRDDVMQLAQSIADKMPKNAETAIRGFRIEKEMVL